MTGGQAYKPDEFFLIASQGQNLSFSFPSNYSSRSSPPSDPLHRPSSRVTFPTPLPPSSYLSPSVNENSEGYHFPFFSGNLARLL